MFQPPVEGNASVFTISVGTNLTLTISGVGIMNTSGLTQDFRSNVGDSSGSIVFTNGATAGNFTRFINDFGGTTRFFNSSSAANSRIININSFFTGSGAGVTEFHDSSTAANATIINDYNATTRFLNNSTAANATIQNGHLGTTNFLNNSTAANATIINSPFVGEVSGIIFGIIEPGGTTNFFNTSTAGNATIQNDFGGTTNFLNSSNARTATIVNTSSANAEDSVTNFQDTSTAANATITNDAGTTNFLNNSTAANATIINNSTVSGDNVFVGHTRFNDASTAANATITNDGGNTLFGGNSTAANATIINSNSRGGFSLGGSTYFFGASTAANATITNSGAYTSIDFNQTSTAGNATITNLGLNSDIGFSGSSSGGTSVITNNGQGSEVIFLDSSTAGNATITSFGLNFHMFFFGSSSGGTSVITNNGQGSDVAFQNNSTAGNAIITNSGLNSFVRFLPVDGGGATAGNATIVNSGSGSFTAFETTSTAADATITNSGSSSFTVFSDGSGGGNAALINANPTAFIDISLLDGPGTTMGSIAGNGAIFLGSKNLTVGGNGQDTLFSGVISDGQSTDPVFLAYLASRGITPFQETGGSLTKVGTGTLTLTGANTYIGPTTVNGGTLRAGAINTLPSQTALTVATGATFDLSIFDQSVGSLAGDGSITLGTATLTTGNNNTSTDFSGVISGSGSLIKTGTGIQTLSGTNTFVGPTTVAVGTLLVDGSLVSGVGVDSGATLGGTGTAAGAVTINDGGILAPGNSPGTPGTSTVGSLSLSNASLLNYDLGTPGVIGSGANDLTIVTGNLALDGILNTTALAGFGPGAYRLFNYGGALTDNTLDIGTVPADFSASNFTVITGFPNEVDLLVLAGPLPLSVQFWDGPNIRSNGVIDGGTGNWDNFTTNWTNASGNTNSSWRNGVAVFAGTAGTVTVTQPIFFAGLEFMTDGYQIDQGVRGSLNLIGSPFITTESDVTATINATLAGAGGITKEGVGTLILNGANTYLGTTAIDAGSLIVDGSIASAQALVNAGGLLGGGGIIGGDLTNGGIVSPGHSPGSLGTLTVNGNYTQTANGTLRIEIAGTAPGQFDLLAVGGHASLAGTLQLIRLGNFQFQVGDKLSFLTAQGGVSGTFSPIQNPFVTNTLIKAEINILASAVQLEGTQGSFTEVACNPNTLAVANALDSAVGDPRAAGLIEFLDTQPLSELCPELELISPEELAAMFNIGVSLANIQTVNLERRMEDIRAGSTGFSARGLSIDSRVPESSSGLAGPTGPEGKSGPSVMQPTPQNRWGVFVTGLGEFTSVDDTSIAPGYNFSTGGLTFGVDYRVSPNFAIGLTGGYADTNADLVNNGSLDVNGGTIGAYATGFGGGFHIDAAAFGVFNGYDSHRTALLGTASGNTDGQDFNALVAAGYDWKSGGLTIGPTVSYQYTYVEFDSFTEHGSLAPLSFGNQNAESSRTALGAKASYDWHAGHVLIRPEIRASWQHEFGDRDYSVVSRFANGAGNSFSVNGPAVGRDSLLIGAGAAVIFNDRVSVYAYYDGELARTNYSSNNVSAGLRFTF